MNIHEWRGYGMLTGFAFFLGLMGYVAIVDALKKPADAPVSTYLRGTRATPALTTVRLMMHADDLKRARPGVRAIAEGRLAESVGYDSVFYRLNDDGRVILVGVTETFADSAAADSAFTTRVGELRDTGRSISCREASESTTAWKDAIYAEPTEEAVRLIRSGTGLTTTVAWGDVDVPAWTTSSWCP